MGAPILKPYEVTLLQSFCCIFAGYNLYHLFPFAIEDHQLQQLHFQGKQDALNNKFDECNFIAHQTKLIVW